MADVTGAVANLIEIRDLAVAIAGVLDAEPDSCSLTMGTTNFGDDVFLNPWPFVTELYQLSQERQVVPDLAHLPFQEMEVVEQPLGRGCDRVARDEAAPGGEGALGAGDDTGAAACALLLVHIS